jgi:hypothetical protein
MGPGIFDWIAPIAKTKEQDFVDKVGLDAAVFMRTVRMLRNIFTILTVIGCAVLIPTYLVTSAGYGSDRNGQGTGFFLRLTPQNTSGNPIWALVVCAYAFDIVICYFLWRNYRAVVRLRRAWFDSPEYQRSLHSRTLLLTDIPKETGGLPRKIPQQPRQATSKATGVQSFPKGRLIQQRPKSGCH